MDPQTQKKLIGAVVAAGCAIAVYYGVISQKQSASIQNQADQTLGTGPAQQQQPAPQNPQAPTTAQNPSPPQNAMSTAAPSNAAPQSTPSPAPSAAH